MSDKEPKKKKNLFDAMKDTFNNFVDEKNLEQGLEQSGFFRAVRLGRIDEVVQHLKNGQDINAYGLGRQTALHTAVSKNNLEMFETLLKNNADPFLPADDTYGTTVIDRIISRDAHQMLGKLRKYGIDLNKPDQRGETALFKAVEQNKPKVVRELLLWGADPLWTGKGQMTPVMLAMSRGYVEVVDALLEHKAVQTNLNQPEAFGMAKEPLMHQILEFGSEDLAPVLMKYGVDINVYNDDGLTPLQNGISRGEMKYVSLLAEKGADMNAMPSVGEGYLPLHFACDPWRWKNINTTAVLRILLFTGADPNILDKKDNATPLSILLRKDNVADITGCVDVLLDFDAVTNVYDSHGKTPLLYALDLDRKKMEDIIVKLLEAGANPNFPEKDTGKTPLHYAVLRGDDWLVEKMMEYGGKPQQKDKNGDTPLSIARKQTPSPAYLAVLQGTAVAGKLSADAAAENPQQAQPRTKRKNGGNRPR